MGGGSESSTVQNNDPWAEAKPYLIELLKRANTESNTDKEYYPGQTYTDLSSTTQSAIDALTSSGSTTSDTTAASKDQTLKTLAGYYLGRNPELENVTSSLTRNIGATVGDRFSAAGGYGYSPGERQNLEAEVASAAAPYYYGAYENERGRMMDATKNASMYEDIESGDLTKLLTAGGLLDEQSQKAIDEAIKRWDFEQGEEQGQVSWLSQILSSISPYNKGSSTTKSETDQTGTYVGTGVAAAATVAMAAAVII